MAGKRSPLRRRQVTYSPRFRRSFRAAPLTVQRTFERKLDALFTLTVSDLLRHPGLRANMLEWEHGGGFSLDAGIRVDVSNRAGLERLLRYCARPAFAGRPGTRRHRSRGALHTLGLVVLVGHAAGPNL